VSTADRSTVSWFKAAEAWDGVPPAAFALSGEAARHARGTARLIVARALALDPAEVDIEHSAGLAPRIVRSCGTPLGLSLARREPFAAIALARTRIGVDVEVVDVSGEVPWNVLHARETAFLRGLSLADLAPAFTRLWTLKEAYAKALGTGFRRDPASFCVLLEDAGRATVVDPEAELPVAEASTMWLDTGHARAAFGCVLLEGA
jgi:4'-phosphopantetheinyl transferase